MHPIFIVGCQRSGTSVLWKALCQHPDLQQQGPEDDGRPSSTMKELWFLREFFKGRDDTHRPHAESRIDKEYTQRFAEFVNQFLVEKYAKNSGRWISAHPEDGLYLKQILELFPTARILYLLRHPQEVVWSAGHAPWMRQKSRSEFLLYAVETSNWWRRFAEIAVGIENRNYGDRVMIIRHEKILAQPEATIRAILSHVNVGYQEEVALCLSRVFNSSFVSIDAPQDKIVRSRSQISSDKKFCRYIVSQVGDLMRYFKYDDLSGVYRNPEKAYNPKLFEIKLLRKLNKYLNALVHSRK